MSLRPGMTIDVFNKIGIGYLPGELGIEILELGEGRVASRLRIEKRLFAPNNFLHAATIIALADTSAGYGCVAHLPPDASGFTTIELKSNFIGAAREGYITCLAEAQHLGRTTQLWDATVVNSEDKPIAMFRCTQLLLRGGAPIDLPSAG